MIGKSLALLTGIANDLPWGYVMEVDLVVKVKPIPKDARKNFLRKAARNFHTLKWHDALLSMPEECSEDDLRKSGIPKGWYLQPCNVCSEYVDAVVCMDINGGEYDYHVCEACLVSALEKIRGVK